MTSLLATVCTVVVFSALSAVLALPDPEYDFPLSLQTGETIPGTPLLHDILDVSTDTIRDFTLSFWMSAKKTKADNVRKDILGLGTDTTALQSRYTNIYFRTRNLAWHKSLDSSMGYSSVNETWVHIGVVVRNEKITSYFDGYPTEEAPITLAFQDRNFGTAIGFVSLSDETDDIRLQHLLFEFRVWTADQMLNHVKQTAPDGANLGATRIPEQGFGQVKFGDVFRNEFLFGRMPPPFSLPRLLFGKDDIPALRRMFDANDKMKTHKINAEFMIETFMNNRLSWLADFPTVRQTSNRDATDLVNLLFAAILVDHDEAHTLLADATMRIIRSKADKLKKLAELHPTSKPWESTGMVNVYHFDGLALMLDLSGPKLSRADIEEGLSILSIGVQGRRASYSRHVTGEDFGVYAHRRRFTAMRYNSNKNVWFGSALATIHLLLHGHPGMHHPRDVYATYNVFREQIRSQLSPEGLSSESGGKTAMWRGFLPWIMLARHRIPGINECMWNADRLQRFATAKQLQITPPSPVLLDHGTWAMSTPRESWAAFHTLLDSPKDNRDNAWLARLGDPYMPLNPEYARRLISGKGTGLFRSTGPGRTHLLVIDEGHPIKPVYTTRRSIVAFRNSDRSCVVSEKPIANSSANWRVALRVRTAADGSTDGKLIALHEDGDTSSSVLSLHVKGSGSVIEITLGGTSRSMKISTGKWLKLTVEMRSGLVSLHGAGAGVPYSRAGRIGLVIGSFMCLSKPVAAHQGISTAPVRNIRVYQSGRLVERWSKYEHSSFGRKLRYDISLFSILDQKHWSATIRAADVPTSRSRSYIFDNSMGYYFFGRSGAPVATAVAVHAQDNSGGHVFKGGGHFDVFGVGTAWLFVENRFASESDNYNTILVDGKRAPGKNNAEQAISTGGKVARKGAWVNLDMRWFYRHSSRIHDGNRVGYDESAPLSEESVAVRTATRTITSVNIGPKHHGVIVVADKMSMLRGGKHTYTWLGQIFERHGVQVDSSGSRGLVDIWLNGDEEYEFSRFDERKDAPMNIYGVSIPAQFTKRYSKPRRCLIRVVRAGGATSVSVEVRDRFRSPVYGQGKPHDVYDKPAGAFTYRIAKQLRVEAVGQDADFVMAIYPMVAGAAVPDITWNDARETVDLRYGGLTREVRRDGKIV